MMIALWIVLGVVTYFLGVSVTQAYELRTCEYAAVGHKYKDRWRDTKECVHILSDNPFALFLPVVLAAMIVVSPFWLGFGGADKLARRLGAIPTREQRLADREKELRKLEQQRNIERKANKKRVAELEAELLDLKQERELA